MEILKAVVVSHTDTKTKSGRFNAKIKGDTLSVEVIYTSPYFQRHFHGMFAPPTMGSEILIGRDEDNIFYYISTIVDYSIDSGSVSTDTKGNLTPLTSEKRLYNDAGQPQAITFKNAEGAGLKVSSYYNTPINEIVSDATLQSATGNKIVVSDSPDAEGISIMTKHGDGINLVSAKNRAYGGGTMDITTTNSQSCVVLKGEYSVKVHNGRDLTLRNNSMGTNSLPAIDPTNVNPLMNPLLWFGNINLVSKWRDINIYTDNPAITPPGYNSNIFISTDRGVIQLKSNGDVTIYSNTGNVTVEAANSLNFVAGAGDINFNAMLGNINLMAGGDINAAATLNFNAEGTVTTNLGSGSPLHLNKPGGSGASVARATAPIITPVTNQKFNVYGK